MRTLPIAEQKPTVAWLESTPREGEEPLRANLAQFPFIIGRNDTCDLTIPSTRVSREHVRIEQAGAGYFVRDLGSTNGTFVNGVKIKESPLTDGDLLTVANFGLIFHLPKELAGPQTTQRFTNADDPPVEPLNGSRRIIDAVRSLQELALCRGVRTRLQAIVTVGESETIGYEILPGKTESTKRPALDVRVPEGLDCTALARAYELSRMLAVEQLWELFGDVLMFLPAGTLELQTPHLIDSLDRLKQRPTGEARLVLQIPPGATGDAKRFRDLRDQLQEIGVALALDRFAGSRSELDKLRDSPPDYLKLTASAVQSLSRSPDKRRELQELLEVARAIGSRVIGCGVVTEDDWQACKTAGIPLAQGEFAAAAMPLDACGAKR